MTTKNTLTESTNEIKRRRTAGRNSILVFILLLAALMAGSSTDSTESLSGRDMAWIAITFIALCTIVWSLIVKYRQADERQKQTQCKAASIAFMAVMFGLFATQMLHAVHVVDITVAAQVLFIGGVLIWEGLLWAFDRRAA